MKNSRDLILGEIAYISIIYPILAGFLTLCIEWLRFFAFWSHNRWNQEEVSFCAFSEAEQNYNTTLKIALFWIFRGRSWSIKPVLCFLTFFFLIREPSRLEVEEFKLCFSSNSAFFGTVKASNEPRLKTMRPIKMEFIMNNETYGLTARSAVTVLSKSGFSLVLYAINTDWKQTCDKCMKHVKCRVLESYVVYSRADLRKSRKTDSVVLIMILIMTLLTNLMRFTDRRDKV